MLKDFALAALTASIVGTGTAYITTKATERSTGEDVRAIVDEAVTTAIAAERAQYAEFVTLLLGLPEGMTFDEIMVAARDSQAKTRELTRYRRVNPFKDLANQTAPKPSEGTE